MDVSLSTAQLAFVIGVERKRIENDIHRKWLPVEPSVGSGNARTFDRDDVFRCLFFYTLREIVGVEASVARDIVKSTLAHLWRRERGRTFYAVYRFGGGYHCELTVPSELFSGEPGFSVYPSEEEDGGAAEAKVHAVTLIDATALDAVISENVAELQHFQSGLGLADRERHTRYFERITKLNEGYRD